MSDGVITQLLIIDANPNEVVFCSGHVQLGSTVTDLLVFSGSTGEKSFSVGWLINFFNRPQTGLRTVEKAFV